MYKYPIVDVVIGEKLKMMFIIHLGIVPGKVYETITQHFYPVAMDR